MIIADTHAWIWWISESRRLSKRARAAFDEAAVVGLSAISLWEIAALVERGRLQLDRNVLVWVRQALAVPRARLVSISPEIAVIAARWDWEHRDPADRIIAATAKFHAAPLITKDERIRAFKGIETIW